MIVALRFYVFFPGLLLCESRGNKLKQKQYKLLSNEEGTEKYLHRKEIHKILKTNLNTLVLLCLVRCLLRVETKPFR